MSGRRLLRVVLGSVVAAGTLTLGGSAPARADHDSCGVLGVVVNPTATRAFGEYMRREHSSFTAEGEWHDHYWTFKASNPRDERVDCNRSAAEITYDFKATVKYVKKVRVPFRKHKKTVTVWQKTFKGHFTVEAHWTYRPPTTGCADNAHVKELHVDNFPSEVEREIRRAINKRLEGEYCHSLI